MVPQVLAWGFLFSSAAQEELIVNTVVWVVISPNAQTTQTLNQFSNLLSAACVFPPVPTPFLPPFFFFSFGQIKVIHLGWSWRTTNALLKLSSGFRFLLMLRERLSRLQSRKTREGLCGHIIVGYLNLY